MLVALLAFAWDATTLVPAFDAESSMVSFVSSLSLSTASSSTDAVRRRLASPDFSLKVTMNLSPVASPLSSSVDRRSNLPVAGEFVASDVGSAVATGTAMLVHNAIPTTEASRARLLKFPPLLTSDGSQSQQRPTVWSYTVGRLRDGGSG